MVILLFSSRGEAEVKWGQILKCFKFIFMYIKKSITQVKW